MIARVKKGLPTLPVVLANIKELRLTTSRIAKEYAAKASQAETALEAKESLEHGYEE